MKQFIILFFLIIGLNSIIAQSGINTNTPDTSAILDVFSTNMGFLPPRLTTAQRDAIATPAEGLTIYNTTVNCLQWWNGSYWYDGCTNQMDNLINLYPAGTVFCESGPTEIVNVTNPMTGEIWMDRNLGASRAATSSTDFLAYGSMYQWGRFSDGHQCINWSSSTASDGAEQSNITFTQSATDTPENGKFILGEDWRSTPNHNLWQGVSGINNPCPSGYRLPTETELNNERLSWVLAPINSTNNAAGAFASPLKLPVAGDRSFVAGQLSDAGIDGYYWSSTVSGNDARYLVSGSGIAVPFTVPRARGASVRCIKD